MKTSAQIPGFALRPAMEDDVPLILSFIRDLAEYERLSHEVVATEEGLRRSLFGQRRVAEVVLGYYHREPVSFALYFHNFSTFLGQAGIYLEDLYVQPAFRGKGFGRVMLSYLAQLAKERDCGRLEWWVLDWNKAAIKFYQGLGAQAMEEWTVYRVTGEALERLAAAY